MRSRDKKWKEIKDEKERRVGHVRVYILTKAALPLTIYAGVFCNAVHFRNTLALGTP